MSIIHLNPAAEYLSIFYLVPFADCCQAAATSLVVNDGCGFQLDGILLVSVRFKKVLSLGSLSPRSKTLM